MATKTYQLVYDRDRDKDLDKIIIECSTRWKMSIASAIRLLIRLGYKSFKGKTPDVPVVES